MVSTGRTAGCVLVAVVALAVAFGAAARAESPEETFQSLFGDELKKVQAAGTPRQAADLADKLLKSAKGVSADREFQALLCQKAYDLAARAPEGYQTAIDAMKLLAEGRAELRASCIDKTVDIYQKWLSAVRGGEHAKIADAYFSYLLDYGDQFATEGDWTLAAKLHRAALAVAEASRPTRKDEAAGREMLSSALQKSAVRLEQAQAKLKATPTDAAQAKTAMTVCLVDFDDPNAASAFVEASDDPEAKTYVPLACQDARELAEAVAMEMAEWYRNLSVNAADPGKGFMLRRAQACYARFLALHTAADRENAKAKSSLEQVEQKLPKYSAAFEAMAAIQSRRLATHTPAIGPATIPVAEYVPPPEIVEFAKQRDALLAEKQLEFAIAKIKEFSGIKDLAVDIRMDSNQPVGFRITDGSKVTTLEPLWGMKLRSIVLRNCKSLKSLHGLQNMPLTELSLMGTEVLDGDLSDLKGTKLNRLEIGGAQRLAGLNGIAGLPLENLQINGCKNLRGDLAILKGMPLATLRISATPGITGVAGVRGLPLRELVLNGCDAISGDLSFLNGMGELRRLELQNCQRLTSLAGVEDLLLERLNLSNCGGIRDLTPLKNVKLRDIALTGCTNLTDLNGLQSSLITNLDLSGCKNLRGDLTVLKGLNINTLSLNGCENFGSLLGIGDLPLNTLSLDGCPLAKTELGMLKGLKLTSLNLNNTGVSSLQPLVNMPLRTLSLASARILTGDLGSLKSLKDLVSLDLNGCEGLTGLGGISDLHLEYICVRGCKRVPLAEVKDLVRMKSLTGVDTGDATLDAQIVKKK